MSDHDPTRAAGPTPARRLLEERLSRRRLLARMAALGAGVPLLAACGGGATASPTTAPASGTPAPTGAAPSVEPTPVPTPEAELFVYNYTEYIGADTIPSFEKKYGVKVTYDFFDTYETMTAKISTGNSGYDITFATGVDVPGFLARDLVQPLDHSLIPNLVNLGEEWQSPAYDPGNAHSVPYMWWTTGFGYDTKRIPEDLTSWAVALGRALEGQDGDARRLPRGVRGGAHPPRLQRQHDERRRARRGAGPPRAAEAAPAQVHRRRHRRPLERRRLAEPRLGRRRLPGQHGAGVGDVRDPVRGRDPRLRRDGAPGEGPASDRRQPVHQPHARRRGERGEHELHLLHGPERGSQGVHRPGDPRGPDPEPGEGRDREAPGAPGPRARTCRSTRSAGPSSAPGPDPHGGTTKREATMRDRTRDAVFLLPGLAWLVALLRRPARDHLRRQPGDAATSSGA